MFPTLLIVDDEPSILNALKGLLTDEGFEVITAANGYECLKTIETEFPDLVLLDIWMPGIDGIETLKEIKKSHPRLPVIMISGHGTIETAVTATKHGAFNFIEKPISIDKVIVAISNALNFRRLEEENRYLRTKMISKNSIDGISLPIQSLNQQIAIAAPSDSCILISGENGTGKELVARTIHQFSSRSDKSMITVNCAAIPDRLFESELFGHEKGAIPQATSKNIGKFELADGGTLFLDEIGDMSLKNQSKILQVLQEQKFSRLGGNRVHDVNVRIIAATNKNLEKEIETGGFREDLYFRLNVIPIRVPPLRERLDDLPLLINTFLKKWAENTGGQIKSLSPEALDILTKALWPGNVRELKNLLERMVVTVKSDVINASDIPAPYNIDISQDTEDVLAPFHEFNNLKDAREEFEKEFIKTKLKSHGNDPEKTAKALGISKSYVIKMMRKQ
ncbi:MAG: sigma-54 dependent transcriptional regulator [Proteobacteria bacterium]|nr:sigma-54 dependent transcriptional regulator [Pseudomonadota bacterium]